MFKLEKISTRVTIIQNKIEMEILIENPHILEKLSFALTKISCAYSVVKLKVKIVLVKGSKKCRGFKIFTPKWSNTFCSPDIADIEIFTLRWSSFRIPTSKTLFINSACWIFKIFTLKWSTSWFRELWPSEIFTLKWSTFRCLPTEPFVTLKWWTTIQKNVIELTKILKTWMRRITLIKRI